MKKLLAVLLCCLLMTVCVLPVAAEISPTAPVVTEPGNDSPNAPQTGEAWVFVAAAVAVVGAAGVAVATKKLAADK